MIKVLKALSILSIIMLSSCAAMSQKHKGNAEPYYEDLSAVRPVYINPDTLTGKPTTPVTPTPQTFQYDASKKANARIDSLAEINKKYSTMEGFRILVYTGPSSDEAQKNRQLVYSYNSDLNVYTQFRQPSFRVKVGDFIDRVEANYILNDLKQSFPNAMIVPDQINLLR
ncbi:SPOR domain-containing protein [Cytophaga aurantiaca]|uniref:SPOR domain-containing protein n=1 Tax=Cytophaga aurantiaca TaxID=29530 RepID=UPI000376EBBD|nr:SPOR domain-containing protein [Cytophaga aurantiaca]